MMLNYLTPHGKWHIHSTYGDNQRMSTLSRGCEPFWINDKDASELDIEDNDWVEVFNDTASWSRGPRSPPDPAAESVSNTTRRNEPFRCPSRRCVATSERGGHNSLTRARLKPNFMIGGWIRTIHLPLQLLGPHRLQPRHPHPGPETSRTALRVVGGEETEDQP